MAFLTKVEAARKRKPKTQRSVHKPFKPEQPVKPAKGRKAFKSKKPKKIEPPDKLSKPKQAVGKPMPTSFRKLRSLLPFVLELLENTDPFDFKHESWKELFRQCAPRVLAAVLRDLQVLQSQSDENALIKLFNQRVK